MTAPNGKSQEDLVNNLYGISTWAFLGSSQWLACDSRHHMSTASALAAKAERLTHFLSARGADVSGPTPPQEVAGQASPLWNKCIYRHLRELTPADALVPSGRRAGPRPDRWEEVLLAHYHRHYHRQQQKWEHEYVLGGRGQEHDRESVGHGNHEQVHEYEHKIRRRAPCEAARPARPIHLGAVGPLLILRPESLITITITATTATAITTHCGHTFSPVQPHYFYLA